MNHDLAVDSSTADGVLLAQIAAGGSVALEELIRRHSGKMKAEASRILLDEGEAEEVLQEVWWKVWQRALDYDPRRGSVLAWLFIMARRRAIDRLRHRQARLRAVDRQPWRESWVPEVHDRELFRSWFARVRRAFRELSPGQRQVLALAVFRDMSHSEIAETTGLPLGTVKTRTNSAKKRLRQSLNWEEPDEPSARERSTAA